MCADKPATGIDLYYEALEKVFNLQADILTKVLPHSGEQGSNHEEFLKNFLRKVLPKKYTIDTGFIISANESMPPSSQTDIIVADEFYNAPIHRELAASIYPIEAVYATIEVKASLNQENLRKAFDDILKIRKMGPEKKYAEYGVGYLNNDKSKPVVEKTALISPLPPRAFVFAYDSAGWQSINGLSKFMQEELPSYGSFLHGVTVLKTGWHLVQKPYRDGKAEFELFKDRALSRFASSLLDSMNSITMRPMYADPYLQR